MNKIVFIISIILLSFSAFGQNSKGEKIKALKIAYITEQLELSSQEAEQFWPIYNVYENNMRKLKKQERNLIKSFRDTQDQSLELSEQNAKKHLEIYTELVTQKSTTRTSLIQNLQGVLSNQKVVRLIKAENDFNRKLLDRIKHFRNKKGYAKDN
ncbi:hypothetical protein J8281_12815 [Aquimarina sp. U1-2]|uniref:hypothetical protein n=1 Tax=Aquimarina sp. U1-2 TaxID=2823141 RepID=UPI001AED1176|nr:hypothetical protein [Aquimarina sp. U1-2]MBP2833070.1 hypothetical protein [Aquimarina sp. U1-2]